MAKVKQITYGELWQKLFESSRFQATSLNRATEFARLKEVYIRPYGDARMVSIKPESKSRRPRHFKIF